MPHDRAAVPTRQTASIRVPDQLQQAQQPEAPRLADQRPDQDAARARPTGGILHELESERAHD